MVLSRRYYRLGSPAGEGEPWLYRCIPASSPPLASRFYGLFFIHHETRLGERFSAPTAWGTGPSHADSHRKTRLRLSHDRRHPDQEQSAHRPRMAK
jgi:hypothetical protein